MTDPTRNMTDDDLTQRLIAAAPSMRMPATPDIAAKVLAAISQESAGGRFEATSMRRPRHQSPRFPLVIAAATVLVICALLFTPASRESIAGWFGVPGIHIEFGDNDSGQTPLASSAPSLGLLFGQPVTLADAQTLVGFPVIVPNFPGLGQPDEVYVRKRPNGDQVIFLYRARSGFPATAATGIGLMLIQFEAPDDAFWGVKVVTGSNDIRVVRINGKEGVWIGGSHQLLIVPDVDPLPAGYSADVATPALSDARPSANVILWANNGVTYRIESALDRETSIAVAESLDLPTSTPTP